jgi:glycosyltransferase involved in cell wall biosynthesis
MVEAGHQSVVVAAKGSRVAGQLIATSAVPPSITDGNRAAAQQEHREAIERALRGGHIDLIHFHGLDFHEYVPESEVPMVATLHLPLDWYPKTIFEQQRCHLNCVSLSQAAETRLRVIRNGIDISPYLAEPARLRDQLLFLGRICPEKGAHTALEVAHRLDRPLVIAGPVHPYPDHESYFRDKVEPFLDTRRRYIGPIGLRAKVRLLASAQCLLIPSSVAETSSLVAMEAIASGAPVVALRSGALPEVIDHGQTGFIVDSGDEMAEAVQRCVRCIRDGGLSAEMSRSTARRRFSAERMVADYLALYQQLVTRGEFFNATTRDLGMASAPHSVL